MTARRSSRPAPAATPVVRAVRGAHQVTDDDPALIKAATTELLVSIMEANSLTTADFISLFFTATPDLASAYPARAARELGLTEVPLMCATEIAVPGGLVRTVRVMAHIHTFGSRASIHHIYLGGAAVLRPDLAVDAHGPDRTASLPEGVRA